MTTQKYWDDEVRKEISFKETDIEDHLAEITALTALISSKKRSIEKLKTALGCKHEFGGKLPNGSCVDDHRCAKCDYESI